MKQRLAFILLLTLLLAVGAAALAQDTPLGDAPVTDGGTEDQTTVDVFFVACEDVGVINLTGFAQPGFDVFFQLYSGAGATGDELTTLRRINAEGEYSFSERIAYQDGLRVAPGAIASARIIVAPVDDPTSSVLDTPVDDLQDGCNDANNPLQSSVAADEPIEEEETAPTGIASPDGGFLRTIEATPEPVVVLGPRETDFRRNASPGLVFALCDQFPAQADPGVVYDSDSVRVFWYWFADTAETLDQNLARTRFELRINSATVGANEVLVSQPEARDGAVYRFYSIPLGNLRPGFYNISFRQTWTEPVNDGFDDYGPGTANEVINASCNFQVVQNPFGFEVGLTNGMYIGSENPPSDFQRAIIETQVEQDFLDTTNQDNNLP